MLKLLHNYLTRPAVDVGTLIAIKEAREEISHTPDMRFLNRKRLHNFFIYGNMLSDHPKHAYIEEYSKACCTAYTFDEFSLWKKCLGKESYPIPLRKRYNALFNHVPAAPKSMIKGTLFQMATEHIPVLDKYMDNGKGPASPFTRVRVPLLTPYRDVTWELEGGVTLGERKTSTVMAWMYEGNLEHWEPQLDGGRLFQPVRNFTPKADYKLYGGYFLYSYYYFTPKEYDD